MNILLTGATGFVGARLATKLLAQGANTIVSIGRKPCKVLGVDDLVVTDFSRDALLEALVGREIDAVIHLAAAGVHPADRDPATLFDINVCLPARIVDVARKCGARGVLITGSSAEYRERECDRPIDEFASLETQRAYGGSKAAGSALALAQGVALGIPVVVLRMFNVYGPGEAPHRLLPSLVDGLSRGKRVPLSHGRQVRDFIHVDDACCGILSTMNGILERKVCSGAYNLSSGAGRSVAEFARITATVVNVDQRMLEFGAVPLRNDDLGYLVGDSTCLNGLTGWAPRIALEDGIAASVAEMLSANRLSPAQDQT